MLYINIWERFLVIILVLLVISKCVPMKGKSQPKNINNLKNTSILMKTAKQKGYFNIIVQLIVPEIRELQRSLARAENPAGRTQIMQEIARRIAEVGDSVLNQIENTPYRVNRRYHSLPLLALGVSPEALVILQSSPNVLKITADKLTPLN